MARRNENNLTDKWQVFADSYLADESLNATKAYKAAYPKVSQRTAESNGEKLLRKAEVAEYIAKAMQERSERTKVDSDYVLTRLAEIDQMDVLDILSDDGSMKPIRDWPKVWRQFISGMDLSELFEGSGDDRKLVGILKKIKWPDKLKNLELLGKHVDVGAFKERHELTGKDGGPIQTVTRVERRIVRPGDTDS